MLVDFEEVAVVDHAADDVLHVVGPVRLVGDDRVELDVHAVRIVGRLEAGRIVDVVLRDEGEQAADERQAVLLVLGGELRDPALRVVGHRAAKILEGHLLVGHRLDHVGPGDEHVARLLDHDREVGDGGGVDRAAGAGAEDRRDLGDDAGGERVAEEDVGIAAERGDALLDACPARVVEPDHRGAVLHGAVHDVADLLGVGFREGAAEDGEVLSEDEDEAAVDAPVARDDPVAGDAPPLHAEVRAAMGDEDAGLGEGAGIEEERDALARGELPLLVLGIDPLAPAAEEHLRLALGEVLDPVRGGARRAGILRGAGRRGSGAGRGAPRVLHLFSFLPCGGGQTVLDASWKDARRQRAPGSAVRRNASTSASRRATAGRGASSWAVRSAARARRASSAARGSPAARRRTARSKCARPRFS